MCILPGDDKYKKRAARYRSLFGVYRDEVKTLLICVDPRLFQFYAVFGIHVMPNAYVIIPANSTCHVNTFPLPVLDFVHCPNFAKTLVPFRITQPGQC